MKGCPGCGRKLLPTLATLEKVPLRERVYGSIATGRANNPLRPTGFNEAIPAGEGVRECGFHTSLRQLQEHHQIVEMCRQMWRKAALPIIGARVTGHSASKLRTLVHRAIAQSELRILLKGRGQGQNFSWGRRDNLLCRRFFLISSRRCGLCTGLRIRPRVFEKAKDPGFRGMPSRLAKGRLMPAGHIA